MRKRSRRNIVLLVTAAFWLVVIVGRRDQLVNPLAAIAFAGFRKAPTLVLDIDCGHHATVCQSDIVATKVPAS